MFRSQILWKVKAKDKTWTDREGFVEDCPCLEFDLEGSGRLGVGDISGRAICTSKLRRKTWVQGGGGLEREAHSWKEGASTIGSSGGP